MRWCELTLPRRAITAPPAPWHAPFTAQGRHARNPRRNGRLVAAARASLAPAARVRPRHPDRPAAPAASPPALVLERPPDPLRSVRGGVVERARRLRRRPG